MATETERKYLVISEFKHLAIEEKKISQAYLSIDPDKTVRIRTVNDEAFFTVKSRISEKSITRNEWEFQIPLSDATEMMKICIPGKIIKTRYLVPSGNQIFEVDVFHDKNEGLIIAEIELSSEDEQFEKPDWLGEEITGFTQYYNANLIK